MTGDFKDKVAEMKILFSTSLTKAETKICLSS